MWGGLCSLSLAVYFSMASNMRRIHSDVNGIKVILHVIRTQESIHSGCKYTEGIWMKTLIFPHVKDRLNFNQPLSVMPPLVTW